MPSIYLAAAPATGAVAEVLAVYLEHAGFECLRRDDVPVLLDFSMDLRQTMSRCDVVVVLDSVSFRDQVDNWELYYAQTLPKPLVIVSLDTPLDESQSTRRVRLVDFTSPRARDWQRLLAIIEAQASPGAPVGSPFQTYDFIA